MSTMISMSRRGFLSGMLIVLAVAGCDSKHRIPVNQLPVVTLTSGPADTSSVPLAWVVDMTWSGIDPDGHIDHYEYTIDPPTVSQARRALAETSWVSTTEPGGRIKFRAATPDERGPGSTATEFHTFALRAVDDRGGVSPLVVRSFYARTIAPDVTILSPLPSQLLLAQVALPMRIRWSGDDPDGSGSRAPVGYRVLLLPLNAENEYFRSDPDSLIRRSMANDWEGWRFISGDTTEYVVQPEEVPVFTPALFAIVAVDEAGATTTYASLQLNLLQFEVGSPETLAPRIHVYSSFLDFTYEFGGYSFDPLRRIPLEIPANIPTTIHWDAVAAPGRVATRSRWLLDGVFDGNEVWSPWGPAASSVTLPGLPEGRHVLYIEVEDDLGGKSLAIVTLTVVSVTPSRELLVVDDTRREPDKFAGANRSVYTRPWPSAAELDTFLYARGGFPWRGVINSPGAISPAGLLAGYDFDTLGTRLGLENPALALPLSRLGQYRHVLWLVDGTSAQYLDNLDQTIFPITALYAMSGPGRSNTLAAYVAGGGKVWMAGGGAAYASLINFDRRTNNVAGTTVFDHQLDELAIGRVLYDYGHLRSQISVTLASAAPVPATGAHGGWSGHGPRRDVNAPDYSRLPAFHLRTPESDALPPTRTSAQVSLFYPANADHEYISAPNSIVEDFALAGGPADLQSTLDTLYTSTATTITVSEAPTMVYYHGLENEPFVFTGFSLWHWSRSECQALVDFVLQDIWGMPKGLPSTTGAGAPAAMQRSVSRMTMPAIRNSVVAPVRRAAPARLDPPRQRP